MEQISINLTLEETNQILDALGQLPYVQVFQLVNKIQAQAEAQLEAKKIRERELNQELSEGVNHE